MGAYQISYKSRAFKKGTLEGPKTLNDKDFYMQFDHVAKQSTTNMPIFSPFLNLLKTKAVQHRLNAIVANVDPTIPNRTESGMENFIP